MLRSSSVLQNVWLNRASYRTMAFLWRGSETVGSYLRLKRENEELAERINVLQASLRVYEQMRLDSAEVANAAARVSERYRYIPATVVKASHNTAHNYIIINKGSADGVRPRSGIVTDRGVVGIIDAVDRHYSYGLTLMNTNVSVGVRLGSTDVIGPLSWNGRGTNSACMRDIPPHYDIAAGDTVVTSGFSTIFPAGIVVGVTGDSRLVDGSTREVDVTLFQDFSSLRFVTVVENLDREEILGMEAWEGDVYD